MKIALMLTAALVATVAALGVPTVATAQSVWPQEYEQFSQPRQAPTIADDAQAAGRTDPALRVWQPFECKAPISNYHQSRSDQEMHSCMAAHATVFRSLYALYPMGIGFSGTMRWHVSVNPRGSVTRAVPAAQGAPSQTYLNAMRTVIMNINFGPCTSCNSATLFYDQAIPR